MILICFPFLHSTTLLSKEVKDNSDGCGLKFEVVVVSSQFQGKRLLDRHRMVHGCLEEEMKNIHAFQQKAYTPEQWTKMNNS